MEKLLFSQLTVSKEILKAIEKMGFEEATPVQSQSIEPMLEGRDIIAQAPTGTGKTCAFGIPLVEGSSAFGESVEGLVLCPTRELAIQITEELARLAQFKKGIRIVPVYGGQPIERQMMALRKHPQIIVATPGRLMDHMRRSTVRLDHLKTVVLDEADEMLNMGFREDIDTILQAVPNDRQTVLFSATLSKEIMDIANKYQRDALLVKVTHKEITVPTIKQYYLEVRGAKKADMLARILDAGSYKLCLVFCNTKRRVDELQDEMSARGYAAEALHGDMKQTQRDRVMNRFRHGAVDILIATDVAARGIDVDDIEAVFNFDIPSDEEYYVHRIGRTGRANRTGVSYTFVTGGEMYRLREIMKYTRSTILPFKAPTVSDVEDMKKKVLLDQARAAILDGKHEKFTDSVAKFIDEDDENDFTTLDIAAALLSLQLASTAKEERGKDEAAMTGAQDGMTRLFINVGSLDKIKPRHFVELITEHTFMQGEQVGAIDILDKYSFIEVPSKYASEVMEALGSMDLKGRKIAVEKATAKKRGYAAGQRKPNVRGNSR